MVSLSTLVISDRVTYPCPHCRVALEAEGGDGWQGWRRCPACGLPGLPPEAPTRAPAPWESVGTPRGDLLGAGNSAGILFIEPGADPRQPPLWDPRQFHPFDEARQSSDAGWLRVSFRVGLAISLFALAVAYFQDDSLIMAACTLASLVFVLLLVRPGRRA